MPEAGHWKPEKTNVNPSFHVSGFRVPVSGALLTFAYGAAGGGPCTWIVIAIVFFFGSISVAG